MQHKSGTAVIWRDKAGLPPGKRNRRTSSWAGWLEAPTGDLHNMFRVCSPKALGICAWAGQKPAMCSPGDSAVWLQTWTVILRFHRPI